MKRWILGFAMVGALALAVPARAITLDDVMGLARADASDALIMAKIDADGTVFHLSVDDILALRKSGVSDHVITYMINAGKGSVDQEVAPAPADGEDTTYDGQQAYDQSGYDTNGGYRTGVDGSYRGNVSVAFAYYYPHWPGYSYSYYYDPFYWPDLAYYWCAWQPYPYSYWYYDPWYRWNRHVGWYYGSYYGNYYGRGHHDYRNRIRDGRNVAGRGYAQVYDRRFKTPNGSGVQYRGDRRTVKAPPPRRPSQRVVRAPAPTDRRLKQPRDPQTPYREVKPAAPPREMRPQPAPRNVRPADPGSGREMKSGRSRGYHAPAAPSRGRSHGRSRKS